MSHLNQPAYLLHQRTPLLDVGHVDSNSLTVYGNGSPYLAEEFESCNNITNLILAKRFQCLYTRSAPR